MFYINQCLIYITSKFQTEFSKVCFLRGFHVFLAAILDFSHHIEYVQCVIYVS